MNNFKKKILCFIIGIFLFYILNNSDTGFSIGAPSPSPSAAGGATGGATGGAAGGGASMEVHSSDSLEESYKTCNPDIVDILSQIRCMIDSGEYSKCEYDHNSLDCHRSGVIFSKVIHKYYKIKDVIDESKIKNWSELNELLISGDHYIIKCKLRIGHTYFIEFKNGKFRILSLWQGAYGFLDFPSRSKWGNFDGHGNFDIFLGLLKIINGNIDINNPLKYGDWNPETKEAITNFTTEDIQKMKETILEIFTVFPDLIDEGPGVTHTGIRLALGTMEKPYEIIHLL